MIIRKLNTVFHKHSRILFGAFTLIIIVSFLGFLTPGQFGCGDMNIGAPAVGTAFGHKVTIDDLRNTQRRLSVFDAAFTGRSVEYDMEQLFFMHCALLKAEQLGIHVGDSELAEEFRAMPMLRSNGKFDKKKYDDMISMLRRIGIGEEELMEALRAQMTIGKLQAQLFGSVTVTPSEVAAMYRSCNTVYQVAAAVYTGKSVKTAPSKEQLAAFFASNRGRYLIDGRITAFLAVVTNASCAAEAKKAATPAALERFYRENSILYTEKDGKVKPFEQVKSEVMKAFVKAEAAELAKRKAYDFAAGLYEAMNEVAVSERGKVFAASAAKAGIKVLPQCEAPLNGSAIGKVESRELMRALTQTTDSNPVTDAVPVGEAVYVGCMLRRVASRPAELAEVKAKVEAEWRDGEARRLAAEEAVKLNAVAAADARLKALKQLKDVKHVDFSFTKWGKPTPPAGFEAAMRLTGCADGAVLAIPDPNGATLYMLIRRTPPAKEMSEAEKERCTVMCRAFKQSMAASEFNEDIAANCRFTMKSEDRR